jgi:EAL domain-containing protein (putative c-di-GMP-specific phosphodiesterase class I)
MLPALSGDQTGLRTAVLCVAVHPLLPGDALLGSVEETAAGIVGRQAILEAIAGPGDSVLLTLVGAPSEPCSLDDPGIPQALEVRVAAALGALGHRHCGVAVTSMGPAVSGITRLEKAVMQQLETLAHEATAQARRRAHRLDIAEILDRKDIRTLFQPIADASTGRILAYEALSRGPAGHPLEGPEPLLAAAESVGLDGHLEGEMRWLAGVRAVERFPRQDLLLFTNVSPQHLSVETSPLRHRRGGAAHWPWDQVVVEVTERAPVDDVREFSRGRDEIRGHGARFALDDAGAGYAGLAMLALLAPEYVKVDMALVRDCDGDPVKQAIIGALVHYVQMTGGLLIAEGVETPAELAVVRRLGVDFVQGYLLARPAETPPEVDARFPTTGTLAS